MSSADSRQSIDHENQVACNAHRAALLAGVALATRHRLEAAVPGLPGGCLQTPRRSAATCGTATRQWQWGVRRLLWGRLCPNRGKPTSVLAECCILHISTALLPTSGDLTCRIRSHALTLALPLQSEPAGRPVCGARLRSAAALPQTRPSLGGERGLQGEHRMQWDVVLTAAVRQCK